MIKKKDSKLIRRWNTFRLMAAGFLGVILVGAFLLWLPISNQKPITFFDALFTSVTSVCVTGLTTITPATQFTIFGKLVLMVLIQIGGLGVIACATIFFVAMRRQVTVKEKVVLLETYGENSMFKIASIIKWVLAGTFIVEFCGALGYATVFIPKYGLIKGIAYSFFHAISAFCNAGIDILGDSSLSQFSGQPVINVTTMVLIVLGGLGFVVWKDVIDNIKEQIRLQKTEHIRRHWRHGLNLHSKLALSSTLLLLVAGTIFYLCAEYSNPETIGNMGFCQKAMAAAFQSVTTRTAGFYTFSQAGMREESKLVSCILMFVGGSPGGTAGGTKTTTMAMLAVAFVSFVRGSKEIECRGRRISYQNFRTGFCVLMATLGALFMGMLVIMIAESDAIPFVNILFEAASAIGTVGLTADLTPHLSRISQAVIMIMMYLGRLGPLTLVIMFAGKATSEKELRVLPKEQIIVG